MPKAKTALTTNYAIAGCPRQMNESGWYQETSQSIVQECDRLNPLLLSFSLYHRYAVRLK
ncbi:hypothetical protein [Coleofasciculus sp. G2-EDA-02]|uniref:hypothetical protein n=1 Tax=Coleofasciculus sp. G2-EDA-02 TaxID=3069529 RepID=UPI0032F4FECC